MTQHLKFGEGFPPKSIGIVGVSNKEGANAPGYTGLNLFRMHRDSGFQGRIYPINPKLDEIDGVKAYPTVTSVPEPLDLVIVAVPAPVVPQILEDCVRANALNVHVCTSGFGETGDEESSRLEKKMLEIASKNGLRVIGPNCMGFHVPASNLKMFPDSDLDPGSVAFVSQSGGHSRSYLLRGPTLGLGFSKVISYGNALTLDAADFLEYLAADSDTRIICMYLEGVRDGRKLFELVKQVTPMNPVIIWKSGLSKAGARAAVSHTGSLAGDKQIWDAFFKQTGAVPVESLQEMAETASAFLHLKPTAGACAAVLGMGGGSSVGSGDICAKEGLLLPPLSSQTIAGLSRYISLVNQGMANPMDVPDVFSDALVLEQTIELLDADPEIDIIILYVSPEYLVEMTGEQGHISPLGQYLKGCKTDRPNEKPIVVAMSEDGYPHNAEQHMRELRQLGIMVFSSLPRACRAVKRFSDYHKFVRNKEIESEIYSRVKSRNYG